ncbi:MAG: hypothetical protein OXC62_02585 [Aestuariivita sp.]|nr:hypothetical protein [Aestuariivita sp.]
MTATRDEIGGDIVLGIWDDGDGDARLMRRLDVLLDRLRAEPHRQTTPQQRAAARRLAQHHRQRRRATERMLDDVDELIGLL